MTGRQILVNWETFEMRLSGEHQRSSDQAWMKLPRETLQKAASQAGTDGAGNSAGRPHPVYL